MIQKKKSNLPTFEKEEALYKKGFKNIAGVDEAGRGSLVGPVVAAAAILPENFINFGIRDSKIVPENQREKLFEKMIQSGVIIGIGMVNHKEIDKINIFHASRKAMMKALSRLPVKPDFVLVDGMSLPSLDIPHEKIIHGDRLVLSIAAASIAAKVIRDRIMRKLDFICPGWHLAKNKGYPVSSHISAIKSRGISVFHRLTYKPVKENLKREYL